MVVSFISLNIIMFICWIKHIVVQQLISRLFVINQRFPRNSVTLMVETKLSKVERTDWDGDGHKSLI